MSWNQIKFVTIMFWAGVIFLFLLSITSCAIPGFTCDRGVIAPPPPFGPADQFYTAAVNMAYYPYTTTRFVTYEYYCENGMHIILQYSKEPCYAWRLDFSTATRGKFCD